MKQPHPPRVAEKIFSWYCGLAKIEDLQGDIEEVFYHNLKTKSPFSAKLTYCKQVASLIFSYAISKRKKDAQYGTYSSHSISFSMLRNYLKVASRNLYRHKYFSIANSIGLSIGMSISLLLICLYSYVNTFDEFHTNKDHIYRIVTSHHDAVRDWELASAPASLAERLSQSYAGIKTTVRINSNFFGEAVRGTLNIPLRGYYTENTFLSVFSYPMLKGNSANALSKPNSIVLSEAAAMKVFNTIDVLGKDFEVKDQGNFVVTGIIATPPSNSHMEFEALVSYNTLPADKQTYEGNYRDWTEYGRQYVYLLLDDKAKLTDIRYQLDLLSKEASSKSELKIRFDLQAITAITPGKDLTALTGNLSSTWDSTIFLVFAAIALLILLPACFNYSNISIARSLKRSKEIGLRKTLGCEKKQIFIQFITETVIITTISLIGALLLFFLMRPEFKKIMVGGEKLDLSITWYIAFSFVAFALLTGLVAGFFPALHFARLNPIQALKSQTSRQSGGKNSLRKGLSIFQFALSFGFILMLVVFYKQYEYSLHYNFGFQKENILDIKLQGVDADRFRNQFSSLSSVQRISMSSHTLGLDYSTTTAHVANSSDSSEVSQLFIDHNYLPTMKLQLLAGNNFPDESWQREKHIIVNEQFVAQHKLKDAASALGKTFIVDNQELEVIGVVKDFHYASLRRPIKSFFFRNNPSRYTIANLSVAFTDNFTSITEMEKLWKPIGDDKKMEARFFDDKIREVYDFYETLLKMVGFLGLLAVSITLLGLLGMVVYNSEIRTKEVCIRKVMGASTLSITLLLSKEYIKMMIWAAAIGIPLTAVLLDWALPHMQHYYAAITVVDVIWSLVIMMLLGLCTLSSQTIKTASANPADTLKQE